MKNENIRLLVTVAITHDGTRASRREAITEARENVLAVKTTHTAKPKRAELLDEDAVIMPRSVWELARSDARPARRAILREMATRYLTPPRSQVQPLRRLAGARKRG